MKSNKFMSNNNACIQVYATVLENTHLIIRPYQVGFLNLGKPKTVSYVFCTFSKR